MWSTGHSKVLAEDPALPLPLEIRPIRGARRLRLRIDQHRGLLKLTCPPRTSRRRALAWAIEQRAWVEAQLAGAEPGIPFVPSATIPLLGAEVRLTWAEHAPRTPALAGNELVCGGPKAGFARRIEQFIKRLALDTLSAETATIAGTAGLSATSVGVGDAATRWGSCSSRGGIRYSWRLVLAPPEARRFVVAHEVAHLAHLNHGPEFKALERDLFGGDVAAARSSLRLAGPRLRGIGRGN